jgi:hypothetical protein
MSAGVSNIVAFSFRSPVLVVSLVELRDLVQHRFGFGL